MTDHDTGQPKKQSPIDRTKFFFFASKFWQRLVKDTEKKYSTNYFILFFFIQKYKEKFSKKLFVECNAQTNIGLHQKIP